MYKTIRHGENSLQYTILPQNDDFRLDGKVKAGGGNGGISKKSKAKRPKRRSFFAYLGLLFVCTVIIGAILVPFLVSAECLPNPTEWFLKTKNAFSQKANMVKENVPTHITNQNNNIMLNKGNLAINVGKPVKIINKDGVEKIILKVNKSLTMETPKILTNDQLVLNVTTSNSVTKPKGSPSTMDNNENEIISITHLNLNEPINSLTTQQSAIEEPLTTVKSLPPPTILSNILLASASTSTSISTLTNPAVLLNRLLPSVSVPNVSRVSLQSTVNQNINFNSASTQPTITKRIMQVPLLKSTAKKPAIPPVLVKNLSPIQPTPDTSNLSDILLAKNLETVKNKENSNWIHTHWPYIDPSTYFQWNGYKTEDSVLLPALLGFALIGVILIITVCLVARNKRTIVTSMRKRNRNDLEENGAEDNTTLLTNTNLSDED